MGKAITQSKKTRRVHANQNIHGWRSGRAQVVGSKICKGRETRRVQAGGGTGNPRRCKRALTTGSREGSTRAGGKGMLSRGTQAWKVSECRRKIVQQGHLSDRDRIHP